MVTKNRVKWTMLWTYLINFVLVLVLAGNTSAATYTWDDGNDPNELWTAANNWSSDIVPTSTDIARINMADANTLINSTVAGVCSTLTVGYDTGTCYLNMTGGTLTMSGGMTVGDDPSPGAADTNGVFRMSSGTVNITGVDADLWIGLGSDTAGADTVYGTFIMTDGVFNVGDKLELGKNSSGVGRMYIDGGTLNVGDDFELGNHSGGNAVMVMTAGDVNVVDSIKLGEGGGTATIDMDGGHIYCSDLRLLSATSTIYLDGGDVNCSGVLEMPVATALIDITEGELIVQTDDEVNNIRGFISADKIIGYHGDGYAIAEVYGGDIHITARLSDPNLAWKPSPGNYATVEWTPAGPTLSWKPGRYEAKHDVYFGTDFDDVNDANSSDPMGPGEIYKAQQDPCTFAFPSPPPVLGETYYWRIDEVNDANIWKGNVWQFTMADYEEVEDFNSYADDPALQAVWTLTGSTISIEDTIVQSGKSMKYEYTSGSSTEADASTTGANKLPVDINDWTTVDIKALTLYFYGDGGNSAEKMYVALEDTDNNLAVVYYDDPNDINEPEWHEWNIRLEDFNDINDVNLHSIAKIYIGFDTPTSDGTVYFDDIRLYPRRCVPSYAPGDVDGNCDVDFVDVDTMASDWLETDAIRKGSDGVLKGGASWVAGYYDNGIQLDGINDWVDLDDSDFSNFRNKTIAFWVKVILPYSPSYPYMFYFGNGDAVNPYRIYFQTYTVGTYKVRTRFGGNGLPDDGYSGEYTAGNSWRHLALVIEDTDDGMCTGKFYGNGGLVVGGTMTGRPRHSGGAVGVNLGSSNDGTSGFVNAVFDDLRVYDKALTSTEVQNLYNGVAPDANMLLHYDFNETSGAIAYNSSTYEFYHPLLSPAELYKGEAEGSRVVNLKDFAILADSWLEEQLWP